jgi:hypothetical protein
MQITPLQSGVFELSVNVSGPSAREFAVVVVGSRRFTVNSMDVTPTVPQLLETVFSDDGLYVMLNFDSATDRGGLFSIFTCSVLLSFVGDEAATCQWVTDSQVRILVGAPAAGSAGIMLNVGGSITLRPGVIRAKCTATAAVCAAYASAPEAVSLARAPSLRAIPQVVIGAPSVIGSCSALTLNLAGSTGAAGRAWENVSFAVSTAPVSAQAADSLQRLLSRNFTWSPPTPIPSSALAKGLTYTIAVTLCNFLEACGTAFRLVSVSASSEAIPVATLQGPGSRTLRRSAVLSIIADAFVDSCTASKTSAGLIYSWSVTSLAHNVSNDRALRSTSQNPAVFKLAPYSLDVGMTYEITVSVRAVASSHVAVARALVTVQQGQLVARLNTGSTYYLTVGDALSLDAGRSYDEDYPTVPLVSSEVEYAWSCLTTAPVFSSACAVSVVALTGIPSRVNITATYLALNSTTEITVVLSKNERTSTAQTKIEVLQAPSPRIQVTTNAAVNNINTGARLSVFGSLWLFAPCTARWSVDDPTISLTRAAATPLQQYLLPPQARGAAVPFNLVVREESLPQRTTLTFALSCADSTATLQIVTNGGPTGGNFAVEPRKGQELITLFAMSASLWEDPDLPLSYQFGFISSVSLSKLVIVSRSEVPFASSALPAGDLERDNTVQCSLRAFDSLGAYSDKSSDVIVEAISDSAQSGRLLLDLIQSGSESVTAAKTILAVASSVLNAVNCTSAPACAVLNRNPCRKTSGQCGPCLDGFVGDAGDRNSKCIDANLSDTQIIAKGCSSNCTGHGVCIYVSKVSGSIVPACFLADTTCDATCACVEQYSGQFCEIGPGALRRRRELRSNLIISLSNLTRLEDISAESVVSWSANLYSLSIIPHEVSQNDAVRLAQIANATLTSAMALQVQSYPAMLGVLQATDAVASLLKFNYNPNEYTDENFNFSRAYVNNTAAVFLPVVSSFGDLIISTKVLGENQTELIYDNFRLAIFLSSTSHATLDYPVPSTAIEEDGLVRRSSVELTPQTATPVQAMSVKILEAFPRAYAAVDSSAYVSSPVYFQVRPLEVEELDPGEYLTNIEFTFQHNKIRPEYESYRPLNFTAQCRDRNASKAFSFVCPDSAIILHGNCSQGAGWYTRHCPTPSAVCAKVQLRTGEIMLPSACRARNVTALSTTCLCNVTYQSPTTVRRALYETTEEQLLDATGTTDMMASTVYIVSGFADTFKSAEQFNSTGNVRSVFIVMIMLGTLWMLGLLVVLAEWSKSAHRKKSQQVPTKASAVESALHYVDSVIPKVFSHDTPSWQRLYEEIMDHHILCQIVSGVGGRDYGLVVGETLTGLTFMLFLTVVFFDVSTPADDGSCVSLDTAEDCVQRKAPFDYSQSYCTWSVSDEPTCTYNNEGLSIRSLFYLTVLTTILSSIASLPLERLFTTVKAPTAKSLQSSPMSSAVDALTEGVRRVSRIVSQVAVPGRVAPQVAHTPPRHSWSLSARLRALSSSEGLVADREISEEVTELGSLAREHLAEVRARVNAIRQRSISAGWTRCDTNVLEEQGQESDGKKCSAIRDGQTVLDVAAERTHLVLQNVIELRSRRLPDGTNSTREYERVWGLRRRSPEPPPATLPVSIPVPDSDGHSDAPHITTSGKVTTQDDWFFDEEAAKAIIASIDASSRDAARLGEKLSHYSVQHAGLEILYLFIVDLLGYKTVAARVFREKFGAEFEQSRLVLPAQKVGATVLLIGLNAFFIYYILLTGFRKGVTWQYEYLLSCLAQMAVDLLLFETVECAWLNFSVPRFVNDEVATAAEALKHLVQTVAGAEAHTDLEIGTSTPVEAFLNAPAELFVSVKVAQMFPNQLESLIVCGYQSQLPGKISTTWPHCKEVPSLSVATTGGETSLTGTLRGAARGLMLGLMIFIATPFVYQRIALRLIQPLFFTAIGVLLYSIAHSLPAIIVLSVVLGAGLVYCVSCLYEGNGGAAKVRRVRPTESISELSSTAAAPAPDSNTDEHVPPARDNSRVTADSASSAQEDATSPIMSQLTSERLDERQGRETECTPGIRQNLVLEDFACCKDASNGIDATEQHLAYENRGVHSEHGMCAAIPEEEREATSRLNEAGCPRDSSNGRMSQQHVPGECSVIMAAIRGATADGTDGVVDGQGVYNVGSVLPFTASEPKHTEDEDGVVIPAWRDALPLVQISNGAAQSVTPNGYEYKSKQVSSSAGESNAVVEDKDSLVLEDLPVTAEALVRSVAERIEVRSPTAAAAQVLSAANPAAHAATVPVRSGQARARAGAGAAAPQRAKGNSKKSGAPQKQLARRRGESRN